jgi:poly(A) polymerase Pap1
MIASIYFYFFIFLFFICASLHVIIFTQKGMSETISLKGNSKVLPFGSYRLLNNNCRNSDVDLLCVFCCHVSRDDIFVGLSKLLESHVEITDLLV